MRPRDNPFRTERLLQARYRLEGATWAELLARCREMRYRAAIIGPHGSGKTTLLEDLASPLADQGFRLHFLRLDADQRALSAGILGHLLAGLSAADILLLDGAEQMSLLAWRWFRWQTRRAGGLIITTHCKGRLPTLWRCCTSPELLAGIVAELLCIDEEAARAQAEVLFTKHRGNLREALREFYDLAYHEVNFEPRMAAN